MSVVKVGWLACNDTIDFRKDSTYSLRRLISFFSACICWDSPAPFFGFGISCESPVAITEPERNSIPRESANARKFVVITVALDMVPNAIG